MSRRARCSLTAALLSTAACAAGPWAPPTGPRTPAPDAAALWEAATAGCRAVNTWSATLRVAGRVDGERIPTGLTVGAGLTGAGQIRLEGRVLGRAAFTLSGSPARALLLLERERQFVVDRAGEILARLLGTDVDPEMLFAILSGCATTDQTLTSAARVGSFIEISTAAARVYLRRSGASWRPDAAVTGALSVQYRAYAGPWPAEIRLATTEVASTRADLRVSIADVIVNVALPEAAFASDEPAGWERVQLVAVGRAGGSGGH